MKQSDICKNESPVPKIRNGRILCFGDSNTYGFDPRDPFGDRYPPSERWPEILAACTGRDVINMGLNGRTIPHTKRETDLALSMMRKNMPADLIIIMLGSNDAFLMAAPSAENISARMDTFLSELRNAFPELPVFLISPPRADIPPAFDQELFLELIPKYKRLAEKYNVLFAAAALWDLPLSADGIHFSPEAHKEFAVQTENILTMFE